MGGPTTKPKPEEDSYQAYSQAIKFLHDRHIYPVLNPTEANPKPSLTTQDVVTIANALKPILEATERARGGRIPPSELATMLNQASSELGILLNQASTPGGPIQLSARLTTEPGNPIYLDKVPIPLSYDQNFERDMGRTYIPTIKQERLGFLGATEAKWADRVLDDVLFTGSSGDPQKRINEYFTTDGGVPFFHTPQLIRNAMRNFLIAHYETIPASTLEDGKRILQKAFVPDEEENFKLLAFLNSQTDGIRQFTGDRFVVTKVEGSLERGPRITIESRERTIMGVNFGSRVDPSAAHIAGSEESYLKFTSPDAGPTTLVVFSK